MKRGCWAAIILILLLIVLVVWIYHRALARDTSIAPVGQMSEELSDALEGRVLVWSTDANVPLKYVVDKSYSGGILHSLGLPDFLRPVDMGIRRVSIRDEWNLASAQITSNLPDMDVHFYTLDQGTFINTMVSADGNYIVAGHNVGKAKNFVRFRTDSDEAEVVAFSQSVDHWPSCNHDGSKILFHSYRDHNPGGDLYLAIEDETATDGWRVVRLTDRADVEDTWPAISADGNYCVAVERMVGQQEGRIIICPLASETLGEAVYLTSDAGYRQFPSLSASGDLCCWLEYLDSGQVIMLWSAQGPTNGEGSITQINHDEITDTASIPIYMPMITADGRFIVFSDYNIILERNSIGVYDIENKSTIYFVGALNGLMFPSMSNPVGSDDVQ